VKISAENTLLGIKMPNDSKAHILEKIIKSSNERGNFVHVVSLNPEILVAATRDSEFKRVITEAQIKITDGIGVVLASKILNLPIGDELKGVDLMVDLLSRARAGSLRVMLIGGGDKVAESIADCQNSLGTEGQFYGLQGIENIHKPAPKEEEKIFSIVADIKPRLVFVSFGSPAQELWIYQHRVQFKGCVCIGVGGAFDFISGRVTRAPVFIRKMGLEWLYRLVRQPWRWKRQINLFKFIYLVIQQRLGKSF